MKRHFVFGYGSLVNAATHDFENTQPAILHGWQRAWIRSPLRKICYLSIVKSDGAQIRGALSEVHDHHWPELNEREAAYDLINAQGMVTADQIPAAQLSTFAISPDQGQTPDRNSQVLLSYLDTVVQGYMAQAGPQGVSEFFETTQNWQATFINDRSAPIYRRHQPVTALERNLTDEHLARLSAHVEQL